MQIGGVVFATNSLGHARAQASAYMANPTAAFALATAAAFDDHGEPQEMAVRDPLPQRTEQIGHAD